MLANVAPVRCSPHDVPELAFDRLNEHYREVVTLSRLILRHRALELGRGERRAAGFLIDMNKVFQGFVTRALRESLGLSERTFCSDKGLRRRRPIFLDHARKLGLEPDLTWWQGSTCTFVGDAKYKRIDVKGVPHADLYQILAYAAALDLPGGLLVYAKGESEPVAHEIRPLDKRLEIATLDLEGPIAEILTTIGRVADTVRSLAGMGRRLSRAA